MTSSPAQFRVVDLPATGAGPPVAGDESAQADRPEASPPRSPGQLSNVGTRDHRLDFWRGLCLVDMLLVHLIHQGMSLGHRADLWVGEYTRFAAGGFVFIAGLSIGRIFLPKVQDPEKRWATYKALWKRSAVILGVHYVAEIGFLLMWPMFGGVAFRPLWAPIWQILTFRHGYDLLPFYVVMVALAPGMLELMRRRRWWVMALGSLAVFYVSHHYRSWTVRLPIQQAFFPSLWQVIFVAGMLGGLALPQYDRLSRRAKAGVFATAVAAHVVLFVAYYGPNFGWRLYLPMAFQKVPLTTGEVLRYLTLIAALMGGTDLLWKRVLADGVGAKFCELLGRNSLAIYVFHVWAVQVLIRVAAWARPSTGGRIALAVAGVLMLWVFARLLESRGDRKKSGGKARAKPTGPHVPWTLRPIGGLTALTTASLVAVVVANAEQSHYTRRTYVKRSAAAGQSLFPQSHALPEIIPDPADDADDPDDDPFGVPDPQGPLFHQSPEGAPGTDATTDPPEAPSDPASTEPSPTVTSNQLDRASSPAPPATQ